MMETAAFTSRDDARIVYDVYGDPKAQRRVVLVHSLAMTRAYWRPVVQRLEKAGLAIVALDCRGHGQSGKPKGPYSIGDFAGDIEGLLDHLKWPQAVVAGSSMGGSVALAFAVRHPDRVAGLALIDTTAWYGKDAPMAWAGRADAAVKNGLASLIDFQLSRWFSDAFKEQHPDVVKECVDAFLANDVQAYAATCRMLGDFDLRDGLRHLKMPTHIVVGEEDFATPPAMADEMSAIIPHASYLLLPKARHLTPLERPDEVSEEILACVDEAFD
jgi:3-oxoadipate enol-lactonase